MTRDEDETLRIPRQSQPPPDPSPVPSPAAAPRLLCSVGRYGVNRPDDVLLVRTLLSAALARPVAPERQPRLCDGVLIDAIEAYQRERLMMSPPYGRVEPEGTTMDRLLG